MTTDSFEPKEQSKGSVPGVPPRSPITARKPAPEPAEDEIAYPEPARGSRARAQRPEIPVYSPPSEDSAYSLRDLRIVGFLAAFAIGAVATLFLFTALAFGFAGSYSNRVLPGVHAGTVDLSGLTRDEAIAKLQAGYAHLSRGEVTVTTPVGVATITYQQAGRGPDVEVMADAALSVGHSGNPISDAPAVIHSAAFGQDIPVVIRVDPIALALRIHDLVGTSSVAPLDAQATAKSGSFSFVPAATGRGIDENAIGAAIIDKLTETTAPPDLAAGGAFVSLSPQITDSAAQDAIARAKKMVVDVNLTWKVPPAGAPATWKAQTWKISSALIRSWIVFGVGSDGTYAPAVDPAQVAAYLANITAKASVAPKPPKIDFPSPGNPVNTSPGVDGVGVDLEATTTAVAAYLDSLASGGATQPNVEVAAGPIHPELASVDTTGMVIIGQQTIYFFPGDSNGFGANIRVPALLLQGQVVAPGAQFSFLRAVGPIDEAHGYKPGGVILHGKSDHTGAMGGGICSASTTMFDAAARAGLQIDERHAHFYYISRYPMGQDATVYSNGTSTWDLRWTNDTPYPIIIRSWTTRGSQSSIVVQLWSKPLNRKVSWPVGVQKNIVPATDDPIRYVRNDSLKPGQTYRAEYPDDGFETSTTRTVTDAAGNVIHKDTWLSVYGVVNGQLQIGITPTPGPATPAPSALPSVLPSPTAGPRRRKLK